jgi:glycosyltransferase involved in cell wall biosynthesis
VSKNFFIDKKLAQSESRKKITRKNNKRILLIAPQPIYEDRGSPIAVCYTLEALSKLGYSVDLATFPVGLEVVYPGIRVLRTANPFRFKRVPVGLSFRKLVLDLCLFVTVLRLALRNHYDCVHGVEEGVAIALVIKAFFRWPVIYDMQSSLPEQLRIIRGLGRGPGRWLCLKFERLLVKYANCIIASRGLARRVLSIDPEKEVVECIFSGHDALSFNVDLAQRLGVFKRPTVIYMGNFAPYQGLDHLLDAAAKVKTEIPDVVFLLVGGTEIEMALLAKAIRKQGLDNNVQIFARRPRCEVPEYLALADVLVSARTSGENAPLKLFEYMKSGKPIIATDIPAHRTLLSEKTAILVKSQAHALANGILQALRDPELARKVAQAALTAAQINETKTHLEVIAEVYNLVTGSDREFISERKDHLVTKN